ncbi:uncharacterized protein [Parasteatoda tepidariorum]|uniref:uncharacterized protein n=1 Tax=Parasteatoda tepidariorum TaxID=114398 RepID=UPI00077FAD0E|nr:uncharacterized protein LOC107448349 [Parasteatoda tepidariorum]
MKMACWKSMFVLVIVGCLESVLAQQRGSFNYAKRSGGEREGDLTPVAIAGVAIACVAAVGGLVVTFFFCMYVYRQQRQADSYNSSFERTRRV